MKISAYELLNPIDFIPDGGVNTLVIENPKLFGRFASELVNEAQDDGDMFTLSENTETLDFSKTAEVITDIYRLSLSSRSVLTKVLQLAAQEASEFGDEVCEIIAKINSLGIKVSESFDFDASFSEVCDIKDILKLLGFSVDESGLSIAERLLQYMDFYKRHLKKELFIIINLKSALDEIELREFEKAVIYKKITVLLIESCQKESFSETENVRIIDKDLCEF